MYELYLSYANQQNQYNQFIINVLGEIRAQGQTQGFQGGRIEEVVKDLKRGWLEAAAVAKTESAKREAFEQDIKSQMATNHKVLLKVLEATYDIKGKQNGHDWLIHLVL